MDDDDGPEPTDVDYFLAILLDADASDLTLKDVIRVSKDAHCLGCIMDAVSMLGIGAIDPTEFKFEFTYR